jgi:hypothetical protein
MRLLLCFICMCVATIYCHSEESIKPQDDPLICQTCGRPRVVPQPNTETEPPVIKPKRRGKRTSQKQTPAPQEKAAVASSERLSSNSENEGKLRLSGSKPERKRAKRAELTSETLTKPVEGGEP